MLYSEYTGEVIGRVERCVDVVDVGIRSSEKWMDFKIRRPRAASCQNMDVPSSGSCIRRLK